MYTKSLPIKIDDVNNLKDSSNFQKVIVTDNSEIIISEYQAWYADSTRKEPISLTDKEKAQIENLKNNTKWKRSYIIQNITYTNSYKKDLEKNTFAISNPVFFDNENYAIIKFYISSGNTERCYIQIYKKDENGKWLKYYEHLLWV